METRGCKEVSYNQVSTKSKADRNHTAECEEQIQNHQHL